MIHVDRLLFALAAVGIVWMATPEKRPAKPVRVPVCVQDNALPEPMKGPFDSLAAAAKTTELNVKMQRGTGAFAELTVMRLKADPSDLAREHLQLVVRVDHRWFTYSLASTGTHCTGGPEPLWIDAEADAPRVIDDIVTVRVNETFSSGHARWAGSSHVECRVP